MTANLPRRIPGAALAAKRYRLPEFLGGGEFEAAAVNDSGQYIGFDFPGFGINRTWFPLSVLTEIEPPLPPEPPVGAFVAAGADGNLLPFYRRLDEGWGIVGGSIDGVTWADICAMSQKRANRPPVLLVPDPLAEAPELPWECEDESDGIVEVARAPGRGDKRTVYVYVDARFSYLTPAEARAMGLGLLKASES
jgi:hypothetical protein